MREIKFRAWNPTTFSMYKPFDLYDHRNGNRGHYISSYGETAIFMQFTGLKDKNGKEIYEGDIVDCDDQHRIVKYGSQNAGFYMAHKRGMINFRKEFIECGQSQSDGPIHCDTCEVIGNIYESPELLPTK